MTAGDIGFRFLLQALVQGGRSDVIYRMINQDEKPGYGYQLKTGATALTEFWDAKRTGSHNHFMLGHITEWFYKDLCGIDSDLAEPGFKKILIKPTPVGDLTWAKASYKSPHGTIVSHWQRDEDAFELSITIPANTTATVYIPARSAEDATAVGDTKGVSFMRMEDAQAVFSVNSGIYRFTSNL